MASAAPLPPPPPKRYELAPLRLICGGLRCPWSFQLRSGHATACRSAALDRSTAIDFIMNSCGPFDFPFCTIHPDHESCDRLLFVVDAESPEIIHEAPHLLTFLPSPSRGNRKPCNRVHFSRLPSLPCAPQTPRTGSASSLTLIMELFFKVLLRSSSPKWTNVQLDILTILKS